MTCWLKVGGFQILGYTTQRCQAIIFRLAALCVPPLGRPDARRCRDEHTSGLSQSSGVEGRQFGRIVGNATSWPKPVCAKLAESDETKSPTDAGRADRKYAFKTDNA